MLCGWRKRNVLWQVQNCKLLWEGLSKEKLEGAQASVQGMQESFFVASICWHQRFVSSCLDSHQIQYHKFSHFLSSTSLASQKLSTAIGKQQHSSMRKKNAVNPRKQERRCW
jgi:hypothetical protein